MAGEIESHILYPSSKDLAKQPHEMLRERMKHDGHRPPKRPRGPRFGLVRGILRAIRRGGD